MEKERKEVRIEDAMAEKEALDKKAQEILEEKDADSLCAFTRGRSGRQSSSFSVSGPHSSFTSRRSVPSAQ